ncbi:MAG: prolipoprotein diacylglyceryl transferase [Chloroflexota bacterium]|nr:prolipoprotein diacylglyceryl transferase [Chloroflexota bacterium]
MIQITPDPVALQIGPLAIGWYPISYIVGIAVMLLVSQRELARRRIDPSHFVNAMIIVGAFALVGARLYHVIHEWQLYAPDPLRIILPPYAGLGLYGGIAGAALGIIVYGRWKRLPIRLGLDAVIPGTFFAQGIARWGNFFNQELYGPPTNLPWGIAIECQHRIAQYPCATFPFETTGFHPLFFYEFALNVAGGLIALYLSRRYLARLRPGDLAAFWGIWYGLSRAYLETFREGWNWTLEGIPTAQLVGIVLAVIGIGWLLWNHRLSRPTDEDVDVEAADVNAEATDTGLRPPSEEPAD